jgi:hypothetical protein
VVRSLDYTFELCRAAGHNLNLSSSPFFEFEILTLQVVAVHTAKGIEDHPPPTIAEAAPDRPLEDTDHLHIETDHHDETIEEISEEKDLDHQKDDALDHLDFVEDRGRDHPQEEATGQSREVFEVLIAGIVVMVSRVPRPIGVMPDLLLGPLLPALENPLSETRKMSQESHRRKFIQAV